MTVVTPLGDGENQHGTASTSTSGKLDAALGHWEMGNPGRVLLKQKRKDRRSNHRSKSYYKTPFHKKSASMEVHGWGGQVRDGGTGTPSSFMSQFSCLSDPGFPQNNTQGVAAAVALSSQVWLLILFLSLGFWWKTLFAFSIGGFKQNVKLFLRPVCSTVFHAHGVACLTAHFKYQESQENQEKLIK